MIKHSSEQYRLDPAEDAALGSALCFGGLSIAALGVVGIDSYEAQTPQDALGSVAFGDNEIFITTADLGFAGLAVAGIAMVASGVHYLRRSFHRSR